MEIQGKKYTTRQIHTYSEFLKKEISTNETWALKTLSVVSYNQKLTDKKKNQVNCIGFTAVDMKILKELQNKVSNFIPSSDGLEPLTETQFGILFKRVPKYWKQMLPVVNLQYIDSIIATEAENFKL